MPWFLLFELLAPVFEVFGLAYFAVLMVGLGLEHAFLPEWDVVNVPIAVLLLTASILFAIFVTLAALLAEEISFRRYRGLPDLFRAIRAAVLENFGYRQINAWGASAASSRWCAARATLGRHAAQGLRDAGLLSRFRRGAGRE